MAVNVTFNGVVYSVPQTGDTTWDTALTTYLQALATGSLQPSGGTQALTADLNLGAAFGIVALYTKSASTGIATTGVVRLAGLDTIVWRNQANNTNFALGLGIQNNLQFNGLDVTAHPKAIYTSIAGTTVPAATATVINFGTPEVDTNGSVTTGAGWKFTAGATKAGFYQVAVQFSLSTVPATGTNTLSLYKNGAAYRTVWKQVGLLVAGNVYGGTTDLVLAGGDYIDVRLSVTGAGGAVVGTTALENCITINRITD